MDWLKRPTVLSPDLALGRSLNSEIRRKGKMENRIDENLETGETASTSARPAGRLHRLLELIVHSKIGLVVILALILVCQPFARRAEAQIDCIDGCLEEYDSCQNGPHPGMFCDDMYDECVNSCLQ
jgi:hypothetical protein